MTEFILHHYDTSPFSEKIRLVFGYKGLAWRSVTVPWVMPKPDVVALTGGYRRTPFLQIGADIYCDTALICRVIDRLAPEKPLYPEAHRGMAETVAEWADSALFWCAVPFTVQPAGVFAMFGDSAPTVLQMFMADRAAMMPRKTLPTPVDAGAQLAGYLHRIENMLADGRHFLFGTEPCIADFSVLHPLWFMHRAPPIAAHLAPFSRLGDWYERMIALDHGQWTDMDSSDAIALAAAAGSHAPCHVQTVDGLEAGKAVTVSAMDYGHDPVSGTLIGLSDDEVVVERRDDRAGLVHVHFPRAGYQVTQ